MAGIPALQKSHFDKKKKKKLRGFDSATTICVFVKINFTTKYSDFQD